MVFQKRFDFIRILLFRQSYGNSAKLMPKLPKHNINYTIIRVLSVIDDLQKLFKIYYSKPIQNHNPFLRLRFPAICILAEVKKS